MTDGLDLKRGLFDACKQPSYIHFPHRLLLIVHYRNRQPVLSMLGSTKVTSISSPIQAIHGFSLPLPEAEVLSKHCLPFWDIMATLTSTKLSSVTPHLGQKQR
jgi:hypothetical protein